MKFVLFFTIILISVNSLLNAKDIFVNASAKIFRGDNVNAQKQALKNAFLKVVKISLEDLIDSNLIKINYGFIKKNIYNFSEKFLNNYEILKEEEIPIENLYKITIRANVNKEMIKQTLKILRLTNENLKGKQVLLIYNHSDHVSLPYNSKEVVQTIESINKSFNENSLLTLNYETQKEVHNVIQEEDLVGQSIDSFLSLALVFNADILILMEMNAWQSDQASHPFNKVFVNINFSIFEAITGRNIAETNVTTYELFIKKNANLKLHDLIIIAGKHAGEENVRQAASYITRFYQNLGFLKNVSITFKGYSPKQENVIIDYFEKNLFFQNVSELKNTFGYLELELLTEKRKGILRRKVITDLLEFEIETATKSIDGNRIIFINPNPMEEVNYSDNFSNISTK